MKEEPPNERKTIKEEQFITLIDKYLEGKCNQEEAQQVEQWYNTLQNGEKAFYKGDIKDEDASAKRSLAAVRNKLDFKSGTVTTGKFKRKAVAWQWAAAASILLIVAIGTIMHMDLLRKESFIVLRASSGQVRKIQLPDSTLVWLNAGTRLKYSSTYNIADRVVWIDGEAFFDVKHDIDKPFNVLSANIKTRVVGTAFSVSVYPNTLINTVTVLRGKVQVTTGNKILGELLPDQELKYAATNKTADIINVNAEKVVSWKSGKLTFIDMPMQDITIHLQKWYGVNFVIANEQLKNTRFTASFNATISLEELLAVMYEVSHANYLIDKKTRTITYL